MKRKAIALLPICLLIAKLTSAQEEDLLKGLKEQPAKEKVDYAFKSSRVIMSHSLEMLGKGVLDFRILHRFGLVNKGIKEFFGLDQASIRLGLDYGITDDLMVGVGRSSFKKELDGFVKFRALQQSTGRNASPLSIVLAGGSTINTLPFTDPTRPKTFTSRLAYYGQIIAGRKFSNNLTLQIIPTFLHQNLVNTTRDPHDVLSLGFGGRMKLSKRVSLNVDYYYIFDKNQSPPTIYNPLSIGFDIETGGHVFQLHFTNAVGMNERAFLTETTNNWGKGDFQFGFNIMRAFQLKKKNKQTSTI